MIVVVLILTGLAAALVLVFRRLAVRACKLPVTVEWMEALSVDRYRPMLRLLNQEDLTFLKAQPGFRPDMIGRLRRQRCHIFKGYLRNLSTDFQLTCTALKLVMLHADVDRPDLASALVRAQATFTYGLMKTQMHLVLYRLGIASVDVTELVQLFDGMRLELRTLVPAADAGLA
ncbi:MAG TPA: hypothetical protein VG456_07770 [Candidatus Sulfopaludibacter sp.]|jgi:hypothetical protein|nr:hypothetical protein [Candidatus Sulfopaludibacter sp.]